MMEHDRLPAEQADAPGGEASAAVSDLTRWIAILAAPHGYVATAHLLGGISGNRLLLRAGNRTAGSEFAQEIPLESLATLGAAAVASAFDRAARSAFAAQESAAAPLSRPARS